MFYRHIPYSQNIINRAVPDQNPGWVGGGGGYTTINKDV